MKEITYKKYKCDMCGNEYDDPKWARACEEHDSKTGLLRSLSLYFDVDGDGFAWTFLRSTASSRFAEPSKSPRMRYGDHGFCITTTVPDGDGDAETEAWGAMLAEARKTLDAMSKKLEDEFARFMNERERN